MNLFKTRFKKYRSNSKFSETKENAIFHARY